MSTVLERLPALFIAERTEETMLSIMMCLNAGHIRKQGGVYYKVGREPPTKDEIIMLYIESATQDELEELPAQELLNLIKGRVGKEVWAGLSKRAADAETAMDVLREAWYGRPGKEWERVAKAVSEVKFE